jgi:NADH:ubiquinone oxidoreductase subunit E
MKKVNVSICTGTTCYLMGAAHLLDIDEVLDPYVRDRVEIRGVHCLGLCNDETSGRAPFVKVDDRIIADANITKVIDAIRDILEVEA